MTLTKGMAVQFAETPIGRIKKDGIMVISEMSSRRVIVYLAYRHRVGLLATSNIVLIAVIASHQIVKALHFFFG